MQNLTATSTSGGTVTFSIASGSTAGCTIVNSNQVQITSSSATGSCTVAANQSGGSGWDAAPTVYKTFMVFTTGSTTSGSCSTSTSRVYSTAPLLYLTNSTVSYQMTSPSTSYTSSNTPYTIINAGAPGASFSSGVPTGCTISTTSPYGFKVSPTGPTGLTFSGSNGLFTGTPTAKQNYSSYNITATIRSSTGTYTSAAVALSARVLGITQTITFGTIADKVVTVAPFTISATVHGGGPAGQAGALRLGVSRALNGIDEEGNRPILKKAGFLTRDPRAKERKKYGLKKARKAPQYSKR